MTPEQIEDAAREQLADALRTYPAGCDEFEMRRFLKKGPYPKIAYAIAMGWDFNKLIDEQLEHGPN